MLISQMPPPCKSVTEAVFSALYSGVIFAHKSKQYDQQQNVACATEEV